MNENRQRHPTVVLPEQEVKRTMAGKTRRSLIVGAAATLAGVGVYRWATVGNEDSDDNLADPQRRVLDFNGRLAQAYLSDHGRMPTYRPDQIGGIKPNGEYGLANSVSPATWRVRVERDGQHLHTFSFADVQAMPRTDLITRFCCIEGWSGVAHWGGVRFSEFTRQVFPSGMALPGYVYMATPDGEYYVGLDMKSALHSQTMLAWEQNGKPLETRRGAPLRLAIPVKYGIKNIKQVGLIRYTNRRPKDYWADEGYDWFAGL